MDLDLDESTRTENTNSIDATLDLRRNYQNTIDCLIHCEHIINDLTSQLTQKDELTASLEERLVEMSLELASSKAFEDEYRGKRRISNMDISAAAAADEHKESGCCSDVGSDKSSRSSTDRSNSSSSCSNKSTRRRPRFRRASCADEDEPARQAQSVEAAAATGLFRRRSRFGQTPSRDSAGNSTEKSPRASSLDMMEHKKKSKSASCKSSNHEGGRPKHRCASCTDMTSDDHHTAATPTTSTTPIAMKPSWRWSNDNNEDEAFLDASSKTDLTAPLDESCCSSSNQRNMNMSYSLGQFFRSKNSNSRTTSRDNHNLTMEEEGNEEQSNSESISSSHPQDRRSAAREEERKNSSRSVYDGVVFPLSEEDVDRYVGI